MGTLRTTEGIGKAVLRAYLQTSPKALRDGDSLQGEVTAKARLYDPDRNTTTESVQVGAAYPVTLTPDSSDWVEIEVTQGLQNLQFQILENTQLELTLRLQIDCQGELKAQVPVAYFVDPTGFRSPARRKQHLNLQPLLIVYFNDKREEQPILDMLHGTNENGFPPIVKRSQVSSPYSPYADSELCERQEYIIDFREDLGWNFILQPLSVDIGMCRGTCGVTNYNRLLLSQVAHHRNQMEYGDRFGSGTDSDDDGRVPMVYNPAHGCVETSFRPLEILYSVRGVFSIESLTDAIVAECSCSCQDTT